MKKVYLPKWQRYFIFPIFGFVWAMITYLEFWSDIPSDERLGTIGYLFFTAFFLGLGIMFYLMTSGKLPAYIIKDDNDKEE